MNKKKIMDFLLVLLLFYVATTAFLYFYQRNLLYFPGGPKPDVYVQQEPELIRVSPEKDIELEGWYWPARKGLPTIVYFHGNGQAYQYWANKVTHYYQQGYGVLFTDYRGYGGANGKPSEQGIYQDARAFLKALTQEKNVPPEQMVYYGESLGTGVAVQMATEMLPKALILESAYSATSDIAKSRYWMFPVELLMKDQFRSIDKIQNLSIPKLFIHGEKDNVIAVRFAYKLFEKAQEPKRIKIVPNAGHNDLYDHGAALHILSFLSYINSD